MSATKTGVILAFIKRRDFVTNPATFAGHLTCRQNGVVPDWRGNYIAENLTLQLRFPADGDALIYSVERPNRMTLTTEPNEEMTVVYLTTQLLDYMKISAVAS